MNDETADLIVLLRKPDWVHVGATRADILAAADALEAAEAQIAALLLHRSKLLDAANVYWAHLGDSERRHVGERHQFIYDPAEGMFTAYEGDV